MVLGEASDPRVRYLLVVDLLVLVLATPLRFRSIQR